MQTPPSTTKMSFLCSLAKSDGVARVVFATVALGMGINLRDVNTIIHYGAPHSIEDYFQEMVGQGIKHDLLCTGSQWIVKCQRKC